MKLPGSARVRRAARGYESKDAGQRGVVLRGNEDRDRQPALAHPGRTHDPNVLALAGLASPDPNDLTATRRSLQLR